MKIKMGNNRKKGHNKYKEPDLESTPLMYYEGGEDPPKEDEPKEDDKKDDDKKEEDKEEEKDPDSGEYIEERKCCICCSYKCSFIFFGVFILINFLIECYQLVEICMNDEHFGFEYSCVYSFLLFGLFVALFLHMYYWVSNDSHAVRSVVPWAFLTAGIVNILICLWIIIYICGIYSYDMVYLAHYDKKENDVEVSYY